MCGRYSQTTDPAKLAKRFGLTSPGSDVVCRYNIAPTQDAPVIAIDGSKRFISMRWGLIPSWAKDAAIGNRMINARAETLTEKPSFRKAFERRRCLVPTDGFYEWRKTDAKTKTPMHFVLKSRQPFAFAGLWESWKNPDGQELRSFTIITTAANDLLRPIHDRMPVILRPEDEEKWLDIGSSDTAKLIPLLGPYPAEEMETYAVSTLVNSPRNDTPACIVPTA